jgi:hypothetical protein
VGRTRETKDGKRRGERLSDTIFTPSDDQREFVVQYEASIITLLGS